MAPREDSLLAHLEALRRTLLRMLAGTALLFPVGYALAPSALRIVARHALPPGSGPLHFFAPMEAFWTQLRLGLALALAIGFPWNAWQAWRFLAPGLYAAERAALRRWVGVSCLLFAAGVAFCLGAILPLVTRFGLGFATDDLRPLLRLGDMAELAGWMSLAFGAMFQAPVAAVAAVRLGLVQAETLAKARPYAVVAVFVASALLTPPDVVSQLLLALPTWLLFEIGLFAARHPARRTP